MPRQRAGGLTEANDVDVIVEGIGDAAKDSKVVGANLHGPACPSKAWPVWPGHLPQALHRHTSSPSGISGAKEIKKISDQQVSKLTQQQSCMKRCSFTLA